MAHVRLLVVDDEPEIRLVLRRCFELEGYEVAEAANGAEMRAALDTGRVSLVTLDLKLGAEDGLALAREVRSARNVPIVMVTGKDDPVDRVVGLELGADDYIVKPFHLREVLARVRAVLRRYEHSTDQNAPPHASSKLGYLFDGFSLSASRRELRNAAGEIVPLTTAEFNLLQKFLERPGRVMSRDQIMDLLKGHEWSPLDRSIDTLIGRLRKKVETDVDNPTLIKTVRGVGYVFAGAVARDSQ